MSIELFIKQKSLAAEAVMIRKAESKLLNPSWKLSSECRDARKHNTELAKQYAAYRERCKEINANVTANFQEFLKNHELEIAKMPHNPEYVEAKAKGYAAYSRLHEHRRLDIRKVSRATHLARAFLKGVDFVDVESVPVMGSCHTKGYTRHELVRMVVSMVAKYHPDHLGGAKYTDEALKAAKKAVRTEVCIWAGVTV